MQVCYGGIKQQRNLQRIHWIDGNFALTVDLNRMGEQMGEDEYIDFKFDGNRMRIEQAKQHDSSSNPFEK